MSVLTNPDAGVLATPCDSSSADIVLSSPAQLTARRSDMSSQRAISGVFQRTRSLLNDFVKLRPKFDIPPSAPLAPEMSAVTASSLRTPSRQSSKTSVVTSQASSTVGARSSTSRLSESRSGVSLDEMEQLTMNMFHDRSASGSIFYEALDGRTMIDSSARSHDDYATSLHQSPNTLVDPSLMIMSAGPSAQSLSPVIEQSETFSNMSLLEAPSAVTSALGHGTAYVTALETQNNTEESFSTCPAISLDLGNIQPHTISALYLQNESTLPSITYTIPTPVCSQGPILPTQTAFTPSSFLAAAHRAASSTTLTCPLPIPSLPRCYHAPPGTQHGSLCEVCDMQMLACRIWYHASDAGTRGTLREPFIRPGESTKMNRQITESLGLAITGPEARAGRGSDDDDTLNPDDNEWREAKNASRPTIPRRLSLSDATRKLMLRGSGSVLRRMGMARSSSEGSPVTTGGNRRAATSKPNSRRWSEIFIPRTSGI